VHAVSTTAIYNGYIQRLYTTAIYNGYIQRLYTTAIYIVRTVVPVAEEPKVDQHLGAVNPHGLLDPSVNPHVLDVPLGVDSDPAWSCRTINGQFTDNQRTINGQLTLLGGTRAAHHMNCVCTLWPYIYVPIASTAAVSI
jgi:hypothetical protein